jgi:hypothetical protein
MRRWYRSLPENPQTAAFDNNAGFQSAFVDIVTTITHLLTHTIFPSTHMGGREVLISHIYPIEKKVFFNQGGPPMKISKLVIGKTVFSLVMLFMLTPLTLFAQDDLMLMMVPALSGSNRPLKNVVTVAKANGKFTDPVAAVNSITDASATNPYLVVIGPGVYTITSPLQMKNYVDIAGCGENVTKIKGAISGASADASAIIKGANSADLSSLTVENSGGGRYSIALYYYGEAYGEAPQVRNVKAIASGGASCYGVYNDYGSDTMMTHVTAIANYGTAINRAIYNNSSTPTLNDVNAYANGVSGSIDYGIYNDGSYFSMFRIHASAGGGESSYGVYSINYSYPVLYYSLALGATKGLYTDSTSTSRLRWSVIGFGIRGSGARQCVACADQEGNALSATCE